MELILSYASFFLLLSCPPFDSAELALTLSYASFLFVARLFPLRGFLSPCIGYVELGFFFFFLCRDMNICFKILCR